MYERQIWSLLGGPYWPGIVIITVLVLSFLLLKENSDLRNNEISWTSIVLFNILLRWACV